MFKWCPFPGCMIHFPFSFQGVWMVVVVLAVHVIYLIPQTSNASSAPWASLSAGNSVVGKMHTRSALPGKCFTTFSQQSHTHSQELQ